MEKSMGVGMEKSSHFNVFAALRTERHFLPKLEPQLRAGAFLAEIKGVV
jgi:hypothetical protein